MTPRLIFLGMRCEYSRVALQTLLAAGCAVVGLIIPSPRRPFASGAGLQRLPPPDLPLSAPGSRPDIVALAHAHSLPVWEAARLGADAGLAELAALRPDLWCVACFPRRLPPAWLALPRLGGLNLHPSLLPAYRGPQPLFWQFRHGETRTGVSVHQLEEGLDTGDLVGQAALPFPDGWREVEAERTLAEAGARLVLDALAHVPWPRRPQPGVGASYFPSPTPDDLRVPVTWPARRAFNFLRGAEAWGPFEVTGPARRWRVRAALALAAQTPPETPPADSAWIAFSDGAVLVRLERPA